MVWCFHTLNFEARGSSGPSFMLMETNDGNAKMVDAFKAGNAAATNKSNINNNNLNMSITSNADIKGY